MQSSPGFVCRRLAALVFMALLSASCDEPREAVPIETTIVAAPEPVDSVMPPVVRSAWDRRAGTIMAVAPGDVQHGGGQALIIFPELTDSTLSDTVTFGSERVQGLSLELMNRAGLVATDTVASMQPTQWTTGCLEWPSASLRGSPPGWTVGFVAGRVEPVALDSLAALTTADSARMAVKITRLASAIADESDSRFRGLPFRVRYAYRTFAGDSSEILVAGLVRRLTVEASPLEEFTLLVAEGDSASLSTVYHERASGMEEKVEYTDLLAAVRLGNPRHTGLVLARVGYESTRYALLERLGPGEWKVRWRSVTTGC